MKKKVPRDRSWGWSPGEPLAVSNFYFIFGTCIFFRSFSTIFNKKWPVSPPKMDIFIDNESLSPLAAHLCMYSLRWLQKCIFIILFHANVARPIFSFFLASAYFPHIFSAYIAYFPHISRIFWVLAERIFPPVPCPVGREKKAAEMR